MLVLLVIVSLLLSPSADGRAASSVKTIHAADGRVSPVKTIHSEDGDVIDCVDIYKQPSLQHPLLKDHVIKMKPSSFPKGFERFYGILSSTRGRSEPLQLWQKSGSCPDGTIPILRLKLSSDHQARIEHPRISKQYYNISSLLYSNRTAHEFAVTMPKEIDGSGFYGGAAAINVWNPGTKSPEEFSSARIAFAAQGDKGLESIFAGYHVYEHIYGDNNVRLYLDWTAGGKGCYNLMCPGFVQVDSTFTLGAQLGPTSAYKGGQIELDVTFYKDLETSDWWLGINGTRLGYWPASLFNSLNVKATHLEYGGEVLNTYPEGHYTNTQMGNGYFPGSDIQAAYFGFVEYISGHRIISSLGEETTYISNPYCYNYQPVNTTIISQYTFFYGGPGGANPKCM